MQSSADLEKGIPAIHSKPTASIDSNDITTPSTSTYSSNYEKWIGDYDYLLQWIPTFPCLPRRSSPHSTSGHGFIGPGDQLPIFVALALALQHAFSMIGSIVIIPRLFIGNGASTLNLDWNGQAHVICSMIFVSGISSLLRSLRLPSKRGGLLGTGLILMSGPAITFIPIIDSALKIFYTDGTCEPATPCLQGFGKLLGTFAVGSVVPFLIAFVPRRIIHAIWPPMVDGIIVTTMAFTLLSVAVIKAGGGSGTCFAAARFIRDLGNTGTNSAQVPVHFQGYTECPSNDSPFHYMWGAAPWIGLALFVLLVVFLIEIFGPPALRTLQVSIGILAGTALATSFGVLDYRIISEAPSFTFPFAFRFPLGFYTPALLPTLLAFAISASQNIGIVTPALETGQIPFDNRDLDRRIRGNLIADSISSLTAALFMAMPPNPYIENIEVVATTRVSHQFVGILSGIFLMLFGTIGKLGGLLTAVPDPVIGGVMMFYFKYIVFVGLGIFRKMEWTNRNQFIVAISLGLGAAVAFQPDMWTLLISESDAQFARGLRECAIILLRSSFSVSAVAAIALNAILRPSRNESN